MKFINVILLAAIVGTAIVGMLAMTSAMSAPDVHFSYATNECVKVINYTDEVFACETLPAKFNHVWVQ
tara:strand:- start:791 stop:994 length:204 start_codon:yes stop_codon:yes gene_type:complete